jgi:adenosylcobyric acid synthase
MTASCLMVQGTGSHVGKTVVAAGLCRLFARRGLRVAPFKSQNMSLNSVVALEGGEIARAQELQARAAGVEPSVLMNPVLLKPREGHKCEVIFLGEHRRDCWAGEYTKEVSREALRVAAGALERLRSDYDLVVIEGAGSPAEVNLRRYDICNMKIARMADAPVLLVTDIDRGGAIASVVGTFEVLRPGEREMVKGVIVNKFRGDIALLEPGLTYIQKKTGKPVIGVLPYMDFSALDEEDTPSYQGEAGAPVAVVALPYMSNFTDLRPLEELGFRWARRPGDIRGAEVIILPGSRNTFADLEWMASSGLGRAVVESRAGGAVVAGLCGGYQMLGRVLRDPEGLEAGGDRDGLGLLDIETIYRSPKVTRRSAGRIMGRAALLPGCEGAEIGGYEIHTGRVTGVARPFLELEGGMCDGAVSDDGLVFGTHLHGLFDNRQVLEAIGLFLGRQVSRTAEESDKCMDELADVMESKLDMGVIEQLAGRS